VASALKNSNGANFAAVALSASMVWFGTGLEPLWPLLWLAPLPTLIIALDISFVATALLSASAWFLGSLNMWHYFHGVLHAPLTVLAGVFLGPAAVFATAVLLFRALVRRGRHGWALVAFPATWVSFEYLINISSIHGTAVSLAYSQLKFLPVLQLASVTGPWGISFLVLLSPAAVAMGLHLRRRNRSHALRIVGAASAVVVLVVALGASRLALPPSGKLVKVGLISSDVPENINMAEEGAETDRLLGEYAGQARALAARGAQIIVLPEKLGVLTAADTRHSDALFQAVADQSKSIVIAGLIEVAPPVAYNQARVYLPDAAPLTYDKHHMLPPFESNLKPGTTLTMLRRSSATWGVEICKDMDFTPLSRKYGAAGVGLMLVPAWDFDLDRLWHGHIALMRGVESGFSIARAAKQGYLTVSDDRGRILAEARSDSSPYVTLMADVPEQHDTTLYQIAGDWFAWLCLGVLAAALLRMRRMRSSVGG
jgi:apolipoprotein N-acyltransferase